MFNKVEKKSKINVKQEQRIGKFVRDFSIVVQDERSVNYNILRNMLRELLNSQDQAEEKPVDKLFRLRVELDKQGVKDYEHTAVETYKQATQDTPEQKEEWEVGFRKFITILMDEDNDLSDTNLVNYVKQLLLDREREAQIEVLTEIFQTCYQEDSKTLELVEEKLSKLTTK